MRSEARAASERLLTIAPLERRRPRNTEDRALPRPSANVRGSYLSGCGFRIVIRPTSG